LDLLIVILDMSMLDSPVTRSDIFLIETMVSVMRDGLTTQRY